MNNLDKFFLGFNRELLNQQSESYPPFNIVKLSKTKHQIELAVAGFSREQLHIQAEQGILAIRGDRDPHLSEDTEFPQYIYKGLSQKAFKRQFTLADNVKVVGAELVNGILNVTLESILPEAGKPVTINIKD